MEPNDLGFIQFQLDEIQLFYEGPQGVRELDKSKIILQKRREGLVCAGFCRTVSGYEKVFKF